MTINSVMPTVYGFNYFTYNPDKTYTDILREKCQYTYRMMFFCSGETQLCLADEKITCREGDTLFLLPGEKYALRPNVGGFQVVSIFFDFFENARKERCTKEGVYIYPKDLKSELCSPVVSFQDAEYFNKSRVFKNSCSSEKIKLLMSVFMQDKYSGLYAKANIFSVLCDIIQKCAEGDRRNEKAQRIISYIRENTAASLKAQDVALHFGYHKNYINSIIKKHCGLTFSEFLRKEKILRAKAMLAESGMSCSDIAQELGYYDFSHFYKAFVAETGVSPNSFAVSLRGI